MIKYAKIKKQFSKYAINNLYDKELAERIWTFYGKRNFYIYKKEEKKYFDFLLCCEGFVQDLVIDCLTEAGIKAIEKYLIYEK